ncbi:MULTISPECIES: aminotransferase class III-fold pyridoxal phosphate-dependent enzyme [unclassified Mesorhizobium]|uniref:aspartate aminotransferase family protein n=1 Tax=unclassified Mesorhizobium TaxID=325217 RepID=UPI000FD31825|nr:MULTISPECIES: aminotransferase class III-fold pyridoxal phosphate-dependent enzyme [unclassified Mesorhizobium]RVB73619.1 aminotransferase class III-fold pyridoxal phosphate-dependent enzyme [Mesorhizobium sp. M6A.T.Cr.TU.014.01.1.1]RWP74571.1 MAG: aminotransferase class III-fold pyridoxal phosphate-dependent enzyme [Mesorhizobium sp.]RWQ00650.1 MAG: aminotransferase class III-fold pyridoxal phosphate-dependent enzyme [Mesorhizobium sp.]RWQ01103.1 MAG: aminotransferase class III-fold pyridox
MNHLVGGISSAGRALPVIDGTKFLTSRSRGPHVWDQAGRRYIDTALGFGATVLGHAHPVVVNAVTRALLDGPMPAFAHAGEEEAAAVLTAATGSLSRAIFTNTGSEAVHLACRLARAATGRSRIAKMAAGFDGWYDDVAFGNAGSPEAEMRANERPWQRDTTLLRFNDFDDVESLFAESGDIAAILMEPMLANAGCILPEPGYLRHVETIAHRNGAMVILDEVLMGFRTHFGLAGQAMSIEADIATVGKAIGSGIAVAAVVGKPEIMALSENGQVARAGTYSGNPVATAAVTATLGLLAKQDYPAFVARGDSLRFGIDQAFADAGTAVATSGYGSVFTVWFSDAAPKSYRDAAVKADEQRSFDLHAALRRAGLLTMPSPFGRMYLSTAHDQETIEEMVGMFRVAAAAL